MEQNSIVKRNGKFWVGVVLLVGGLLLFLRESGVWMPNWLLSWPMFLIFLGVARLIGSKFRSSGGIIMIIIGLILLPSEINSFYNFQRFMWPILLIVGGLFFLFRRSKFNNTDWEQHWYKWGNRFDYKMRNWHQWEMRPKNETEFNSDHGSEKATTADSFKTSDDFKNQKDETNSSEEGEYLYETAILGGIKKSVYSKNFTGGEVTAFFGGVEINFLNADISGTAILDCTQIFGGTKLVVPADWLIVSEMVAIMGGIEDKRIQKLSYSETKKLVLKGTCVFGGLQILSYL